MVTTAPACRRRAIRPAADPGSPQPWKSGEGGHGSLRGRWRELSAFPRSAGVEPTGRAALARVDDVEAPRLDAGLDDASALVAGRFFRREVGFARLRGRATAGSGPQHPAGRWPSMRTRQCRTGCSGCSLRPGGTRPRPRRRPRICHRHARRPGRVLIGDDTGFEKKGSYSAGVQRQCTGTAGKIANCQLGVFLAYAGPRGRALINRELYLPRSWTEDDRRRNPVPLDDG
jgi:DDE superfamily endonuclease